MKKGFDRLRGVATASMMGLGLAGAGSGRAASTTLPIAKLTRGSVEWQQISNEALITTSASNILTFTTTNGMIFTSSDSGMAINDAKLSNGLDEAFNGALYMVTRITGVTKVFKSPVTTVDLTGDTLQSNLFTDFFTNIDAQVDYYFHPTRPVVRTLYSFTNNSGNPQDLEVLIGGNLGSIESTTIQETSDDDNFVETSDLWLISNNKALGTNPDSSNTTDTPVITISRYGTGATEPANAVQLGSGITAGTFGHRYTINISGNSTARIMVFAELNKTVDDAKDCAKDFETLDDASNAGLLTGLTAQQQIEIVNYVAATGTATASSCIHTSGGGSGSGSGSGGGSGSSDDDDDKSTGALSAPAMATLLGLLTLSRVRRKEEV